MTSSVVLPSYDDPVAAAGAGLVGGRPGRHARLGWSWWTPVRVVVAFAVVACFFGWLQKAPCRTHAWSNDYQYTHLCYSDVYALGFSEHLVAGKAPYLDQPVEYPVVIGGAMAAASFLANHIVGGSSDDPSVRADRGVWFYDITAALLAACAVVTVVGVVLLTGRRRQWDAALVALGPVLVLHAYTNWDLIAVAAATVGLALWARRRPGLAGVSFGIGIAAKLYPLLFFVPLLALCWRCGRLSAWWRAVAGAAVTWLVLDVPIWIVAPSAFGRFYALNRSRIADWDSLWLMLQHARGKPLDSVSSRIPTLLNTAVGASIVVGLVLVIALILLAPRRPRVPQVLFLALVVFLLANKVYSPQYDLWVLPIAALAYPRWRPLLAWQAASVALLVARFYLFVGNDTPARGITIGWFFAAVGLRDVLLALIAALVVRDIVRPSYDAVRKVEDDDPAGGVLDGAPDARRRLRRVVFA